MIGSARLKPAYTATTVCFAGERPVVIDGSFAPEPDAMGAIAIISVDNLDQALASAGSWPVGGHVEIRPLATPGGRLFADVRTGPCNRAMKYALVIVEDEEELSSISDVEREFHELVRWFADLREQHKLIASGRLEPRRTASTVSWKQRAPVLTDGPFLGGQGGHGRRGHARRRLGCGGARNRQVVARQARASNRGAPYLAGDL